MTVCALMVGELHADSKPFSQYGLVQGVQNYSSNPFWSPNAPYNMRMPVPVYVNGPDITPGECQTLVAELVSSTCAAMNNCRGTQISDIRPSVMLALSRMPGNRNYATACMGYIDTAYSEYMKSNANKLNPNVRVPTYTVANPMTSTESTAQIYSAPQKPEWQSEMESRAAELESYRTQTTDTAAISATKFPTTYADASFKDRIDNEKAGYEPFNDAKAYHTIKLESQDAAIKRRNEALKQQSKEACKAQQQKDYESADTVSATFCAKCREHTPYKEWCDNKDDLADNKCLDWCEKYNSENSSFCNKCRQDNETEEWCKENDPNKKNKKCEQYWLGTAEWEEFCNNAHHNDTTIWSEQCKKTYCDRKESGMNFCHTIEYCKICKTNNLCSKIQYYSTLVANEPEFYRQYCSPCRADFVNNGITQNPTTFHFSAICKAISEAHASESSDDSSDDYYEDGESGTDG